MTNITALQTSSSEVIDAWATDPKGPVALHLKQKLIPVEGEGGVIFPPTFVDIDYNIDLVGDKKVALIDSVGSQANRLEPVFRDDPYKSLVPQIEITAGPGEAVSIFEVGHRLGDAVVRSSALGQDAEAAFEAFLRGDATLLAKLGPTSIVFGSWDSRGTQAKLPRIVQSVIRAWDIYELKRSAQYEPPFDYSKLDDFNVEEVAKAEKITTKDLSERGFLPAPSIGNPGGVVTRGAIERDITVNLVTLRRLTAANPAESDKLRKYVLGLAMVAATQPLDGYLRQGCFLTPDPAAPSAWVAVMRDGTRTPIDLDPARVLEQAKRAAADFGVGASRTVKFDRDLAKADLSKKKKDASSPKKRRKEGAGTPEQ